MEGWSPSRFANFILGLPLIWIILWLGLVALSVALLVLMRTRWGQSQPLRKCAVLSLLAHVLLACFATTVKIVNDTAGEPDAPSIWVTMASAEPSLPDSESNSQTQETKPWDRLAAPTEEPSVDTPPKLSATADMTMERKAAPADVDPGRKMEAPLRDPAEATPPPQALAAAASIRHTPAYAAQVVDAPAPERREGSPASLPDASRQRPDHSLAESSLERKTPPDPSPQHDSESRPAPRLAAVPRSQHSESALPSNTDLLTQGGAPHPMREPAPLDAGAPARAPAESVANAAPAAPPAGEEAPLASPPTAPAIPLVEVPRIYRQRVSANRDEYAQRRGGGRETEAAVEAALVWLAANQEQDGRWSAKRHGAGREEQVFGQQRHAAGAKADNGMTGLALLAFLGAGHTHTGGAYESTVRRGLNHLLQTQARDGCLAGDASLFARMYCHGMATLALSEAYALSRDERLRPPLERALRFTINAQHPVTGGWRYQPGDQGDTSQLGWQVMALKSAELGGIRIAPQVNARALKFLSSVSAGRQGGLARYRPGQPISRAMTAEAMFVRQLLGAATGPAAREASDFLLGELPGQGRHNLYYWYYATLTMHQVDGDAWKQWNEALKTTLIRSQRARGDEAGSWDPDTVWGGYGGRVYSTSMAALCLEVYYRYLPLYVEARRP